MTTPVCTIDDLDVERGAAALVGERQVALFRLRDGSVHAVDHRDPFSGANVLARGLLGTAAGEWYIASPLHKQRFCLRSGRCLDDAGVSIAVHDVVIADGIVSIRLAGHG